MTLEKFLIGIGFPESVTVNYPKAACDVTLRILQMISQGRPTAFIPTENQSTTYINVLPGLVVGNCLVSLTEPTVSDIALALYSIPNKHTFTEEEKVVLYSIYRSGNTRFSSDLDYALQLIMGSYLGTVRDPKFSLSREGFNKENISILAKDVRNILSRDTVDTISWDELQRVMAIFSSVIKATESKPLVVANYRNTPVTRPVIGNSPKENLVVFSSQLYYTIIGLCKPA